MATITHPLDVANDGKYRVTLKFPDDVDRFNARVRAPGQTVPKLLKGVMDTLPAGQDGDKAREKLQELDKMPLDYLLAAGTILEAYGEELGFRDKTVEFFTKGLHAWPLGYILAKNNLEK